MTHTNIQKPNSFDIKNAPSRNIRPIHSREHRVFKYIFLHHKITVLSKKSSKSKLQSDINADETQKNVLSNTLNNIATKAIKSPGDTDQSSNLNLAATDMSSSTGTNNNHIEENLGILAQVRASFNEEELKCLFKKMLLNFRTTRNEASFFIKYGVFTGTHFNIKKDGNTLNLNIKNARKKAAYLLATNKTALQERLAYHQIELGIFKFS